MTIAFNNMATKDLVLIKVTSVHVGCRQADLLNVAVNTMLALVDLT